MSREKWDNQFLERFATEFVKHKNLWEPSQDKELVNKETKMMEQALGLSGKMSIRLSRFRNKYRQKIRVLCSKSRSSKKGVELHMRLAPRWLRILDQHMNLSEDGNDDQLFSPATLRLERWLSEVVSSLERARRVVAADFLQISRDLHRYRLSADQHRNMWQVVCGQVVRKLMQRGAGEADEGGELSHLEWRVLDLLLLYVDDLPFLQVSESWHATSCPWRRVLREVRGWRVRVGGTGGRHVWMRLAAGGGGEYLPTRAESVVLLQRRWHELQWQARAAFHRYRSSGDSPPRVLTQVLKRYPEVLLQPLPTWRELVDGGKIHIVPMSEVEAAVGCNLEDFKVSQKEGDVEPATAASHLNTNENSESGHTNINKSKIKDIEINPKENDDIVDDCEKRVLKLTKENLALHDAKDKLDDKSTITSVHATHVEVETIKLLQSIDPSQVQTSILFDSDDDDFDNLEKNKSTTVAQLVNNLDRDKVIEDTDVTDSDSCKSLVIDEANVSITSATDDRNTMSPIVRNVVDETEINNDETGQDSDESKDSDQYLVINVGKQPETCTIENDNNVIATSKTSYDSNKKNKNVLKKPDKTARNRAKLRTEQTYMNTTVSTKSNVNNGGNFDSKITMIPVVTVIDVIKYPLQAMRRKRHISGKNDVLASEPGSDDAEKESDSNERKKKRVELTDIEEVRRINSNILTAQVAPNTASEASDSLEDLNEEAIMKILSCMKQKKPSVGSRRAARRSEWGSCCAARALLAGGLRGAAPGHYRACAHCAHWQLLAEPSDARDFLLGEIMHRKQTLPIRRSLIVTNTESTTPIVKRKKEDDGSKNTQSKTVTTDGCNKSSEKDDMDEWIRQKNLVANVYGVKPRNIQISSHAGNTESSTVTPNIVIASNPNVATSTCANTTSYSQPDVVVHNFVVDCKSTNMTAPPNTANSNNANMFNNNINSPRETNNMATLNNTNVANFNTNPRNAQIDVTLNIPRSDVGNGNVSKAPDATNVPSGAVPIACSVITISAIPNTTLIIETYAVNDVVPPANKQDNSIIDLTEPDNVTEDIQPNPASAQDKDKANPISNKVRKIKRKKLNPLNLREKNNLEESSIVTVDDEMSTSIEIPEFVEYCNVKNNKKPDVLVAHDELTKSWEIEDDRLETQPTEKNIEQLNKDRLSDSEVSERNSNEKDVFNQNAQHSTENSSSNNLSTSIDVPAFVEISEVVSNYNKPDVLKAHDLNQNNEIKEHQIIKGGDEASNENYENDGDYNVAIFTNTDNLTTDSTLSPLISNIKSLADTETQSHPETFSQKFSEKPQIQEEVNTSCDDESALASLPTETTKPVNYIKVKSWDFLCKKPNADETETLFDLMVSKEDDQHENHQRNTTKSAPSTGREKTSVHQADSSQADDGIAAGNSHGVATANSPCFSSDKDTRMSVIQLNTPTAANVKTYTRCLAPSTDFTTPSTVAPSTIDTITISPSITVTKIKTSEFAPTAVGTENTITITPSTTATKMNTLLTPCTNVTETNETTLASVTACTKAKTSSFTPSTAFTRTNTTCTLATITAGTKKTQTPAPSTVSVELAQVTSAPCTKTSEDSSTAPNTVSPSTRGAESMNNGVAAVISPNASHSDTTITPVMRFPNDMKDVYRFEGVPCLPAREYVRLVSARRVPVLLAPSRATCLAQHVLVSSVSSASSGSSVSSVACYTVPVAGTDDEQLQIRRIVFDKHDRNKNGESSDPPAERVRVGDKTYQLISANPLVYSQVLFVLESVAACLPLLAARRPLYLLPTRGGGLLPFPPRRPPAAPCPAPALAATQLLFRMLQIHDVSLPPILTINSVGHSNCSIRATNGKNSTAENSTVGNSTAGNYSSTRNSSDENSSSDEVSNVNNVNGPILTVTRLPARNNNIDSTVNMGDVIHIDSD